MLSVSKQNKYFLNLLNLVKERAPYMRTTSVCDIVSVTKNVCRLFIKFDTGVLDKKLSSKLKFRENRASESQFISGLPRTSTRNFSISGTTWVNQARQIYGALASFMKIGTMKTILLLA